MAEMLKRQYDLVVLKVTLDTAYEEPRVRFEIEVKDGGDVETVAKLEVDAESMGIPQRIGRREALHRGYEFRIPEPVSDGIRDWLVANGTPETPLWLHLVKPYGYLGMVPWERLLQPALKVPMLRLPDFVVQPPRETPRSLDVLLCSSGPEAKDPFSIVEHLIALTQRLRKAVPRQTRFHIFTDAARFTDLQERFRNLGDVVGDVVLYSPASAQSYAIPEATTRVAERASLLENPWLLWMRDSLAGRSVDVAHFICHGYLSGDRGALAMAESPVRNQDRRMARFVGAAELRTFLTQIGAWASVFSSPEYNYSEMGLRQLADTIGQSRPGPAVHHDLRLDESLDVLAGTYKLLFSATPEQPPKSDAVFTYCQPFRVRRPARTLRRVRGARPNLDPGVSFSVPEAAVSSSPELDALYQSSENVPAWVAASERYLEECEVRIRKLRPDRGTETISVAQLSTADTVESTLKQIREVVARVASTTRSGGNQ